MKKRLTRFDIVKRSVSGILLTLFIFFMTMLFVMMTISIFPRLISVTWITGFLSQTGFFIISVIFILLNSGGNIRDFGFRLPNSGSWVKMIPVSLVIGFTSCMVMIFSAARGFSGSGESSHLELIFLIWLQASICEEIMYRGAIQGFLEPLRYFGFGFKRLFLSLPVIISAILFGAMHLFLFTTGMDTYSILIIVFSGIILGLIAGFQREKTGSLIPAIIIHACFNIGGSVLSFFSNK
ncbi:MAG TPA: CPBP family intramembrane metalloprotease [Firmicutes bacterium]|nr:CPBP family intramembrane metalloprotease [Bacillota bacterium]